MSRGVSCACGLFAALLAMVDGAQGEPPVLISSPVIDLFEHGAVHREAIRHVAFAPHPEDPQTAWLRLIEEIRHAPELEKLRRVNLFFNHRTRFEDDRTVWHQEDYWATLQETLRRGAGDCEDFSIAKYASLRVLGIDDAKLRLIYVRAGSGDSSTTQALAHMVVGYYASPDAEPQLLDNLLNDIRSASRRPDLTPIFSFNSAGLWVQGAAQSKAEPTARLSRWRSVLQRMRAEGMP